MRISRSQRQERQQLFSGHFLSVAMYPSSQALRAPKQGPEFNEDDGTQKGRHGWTNASDFGRTNTENNKYPMSPNLIEHHS